MKQTSINKLSEVYNNLKDLYDGKQIYHDYKSLANLIQEVIRAEASTPVKGSKFDIFNYVSKDVNLRPQLCGVYHDEGQRIACDARILFAEEAEYPAEYEGKSLLKDGSFAGGGKYPQWRSVIPNGKGYKPYELDAQKFYDWLEQKRVERKAETGKGTKFDSLWQVEVGPARLSAEFTDKLITAMKHIGATQLLVEDARHAVYAKTKNGLVLLMPVINAVEEIDILKLA